MRYLAWMVIIIVAAVGILLLGTSQAAASPPLQEPTVTGTPEGPMILVPEQVNVRLGPSTDYEKVGVLIAGQRAPALGRSPGGDWIQIFYPGVLGNVAWVYAPFVVLETGQRLLPIIEPPPTSTPRVTQTIDPTLAAQFNLSGAPPTRLPTFTPADLIPQTTITPDETMAARGLPPILAIMGLSIVGIFGIAISFLRGN